ncbi:MAG TPA: hypothetical protein VIG90_13640 [Pedomonas sp.]
MARRLLPSTRGALPTRQLGAAALLQFGSVAGGQETADYGFL